MAHGADCPEPARARAAAQMKNLRPSLREVVEVVEIADCRMRKRVREFHRTGSVSLIVGDFCARGGGRTTVFDSEEAVAMDEGDDESATARGERDRRKRWRDDDNIEDPPSQATQLGTQDSMLVDTVVLESDILVGQPLRAPSSVRVLARRIGGLRRRPVENGRGQV